MLGGFSTQGKPSRNVTQIANFDLAGEWQATDMIALTLGGQYRENDFHSRNSNLVPSQVPVTALPNGVTVADITARITGLDDLFGSGAPASWVAVDSKKWREVFNFADIDFCGVECGAAQSQILEKVTSGYFMFSFDSGSDWRFPVRGDIGVRYVQTDQNGRRPHSGRRACWLRCTRRRPAQSGGPRLQRHVALFECGGRSDARSAGALLGVRRSCRDPSSAT